MASLGDYDAGHLQRLNYVDSFGNDYFGASNGARRGLKNRRWHVVYLHDWHGGGNEFSRCGDDWRGDTEHSSHTLNAASGISRASAL